MQKRKFLIRKEILNRLRTQPEDQRAFKSNEITRKVVSSEEFISSRVIMVYVSMTEEVDTFDLINKAFDTGKRVIVPYSLKDKNEIIPSEMKDLKEDLERGAYGILEPKIDKIRKVPISDIDLVIVPGVAFDEKNNRLGRGKGYYDKFIKELSAQTTTIGLCFDFQIVKDIPKDLHDLPVDKIITN